MRNWMPHVALVAALVLASIGCQAPPKERSPVLRILPEGDVPSLGLAAEGGPTEYRGDRLVEYAFDGAYVPMSFGFRTLGTMRFRDLLDTRNTVIAEVYEVESAPDALGLLRFEQRGLGPSPTEPAGRADEHTYAFARGRHYVVLRGVVMETGPERLRDLARSLATRIAADTTGLDRFDKLPADEIKGTVYLVRTERLLGELVALPPGGGFVFHTAETVALVADRNDAQGRLVLIEYPDARAALAAEDVARERIGKAWSRWGVARHGRYVLTFVRHAGRCSRHDVDRAADLVRRIAEKHP